MMQITLDADYNYADDARSSLLFFFRRNFNTMIVMIKNEFRNTDIKNFLKGLALK